MFTPIANSKRYHLSKEQLKLHTWTSSQLTGHLDGAMRLREPRKSTDLPFGVCFIIAAPIMDIIVHVRARLPFLNSEGVKTMSSALFGIIPKPPTKDLQVKPTSWQARFAPK